MRVWERGVAVVTPMVWSGCGIEWRRWKGREVLKLCRRVMVTCDHHFQRKTTAGNGGHR